MDRGRCKVCRRKMDRRLIVAQGMCRDCYEDHLRREVREAGDKARGEDGMEQGFYSEQHAPGECYREYEGAPLAEDPAVWDQLDDD